MTVKVVDKYGLACVNGAGVGKLDTESLCEKAVAVIVSIGGCACEEVAVVERTVYACNVLAVCVNMHLVYGVILVNGAVFVKSNVDLTDKGKVDPLSIGKVANIVLKNDLYTREVGTATTGITVKQSDRKLFGECGLGRKVERNHIKMLVCDLY